MNEKKKCLNKLVKDHEVEICGFPTQSIQQAFFLRGGETVRRGW